MGLKPADVSARLADIRAEIDNDQTNDHRALVMLVDLVDAMVGSAPAGAAPAETQDG